MKEESDFGMGLTYCLALFLAHEERLESFLRCNKEIEKAMKENYPDYNSEDRAAEMCFYGAGDHLYDFQWQQSPKGLKKRCKEFQNKILNWRHSMGDKNTPKLKDWHWAICEAKQLILEIDKSRGIKTIKARWP